jgi:predicted GIY-YIG superfamily endonuclease
MSVKVNEKGAFPKHCTDCEIQLNPGVNCYLSMFNAGGYKCKSCKKEQSKVEHVRYWQMPSYRMRKAKFIEEYLTRDGAGVYAIYENDECIYIGESNKIRSRITAHFSKHIKTNNTWQSPIPELLAKGKINRDDLSYDILEPEDDVKIRQSRESHYIQEHIAKYGAAPKYNKYKTN